MLDDKTFSSLYKGMVRCSLDHGSSMWSPFLVNIYSCTREGPEASYQAAAWHERFELP